jgi:RNA polymerase sigma factor (sigma-70 family)
VIVSRPAAGDLRALAPQVLGALVRRYGHFDACEDAVQEALLAASRQWPTEGVPDDPRAWLVTVGSRRLTDALRSDAARRRREDADLARSLATPPVDGDGPSDDDSLTLLFLCCHPSLTPASQIALTLRAVGGLTTAEIARALFVPEATMGQRISRAKQTIRDAGATFTLPPPSERAERLRVVEQVLYLIFNEGYTASSGDALQRTDLSNEATRLGRLLHAALPDDPEVMGLLALMLLTDARRPARTDERGGLVPLAEQDRTRWRRDLIDEGVALVSAALPRGSVGPYQLQAAIAAVHDEAPTAEATDWPQVLALYDLLERMGPNPMVTLNRAVALAEVRGPAAALDLLISLADDARLRDHHRFHAVRAHLLEQLGDADGAAEAFRTAARLSTSRPERRHLERRAARISRF